MLNIIFNVNFIIYNNNIILFVIVKSYFTQGTRDTGTLSLQCWSIVCDVHPTLKQHCGSVSCSVRGGSNPQVPFQN